MKTTLRIDSELKHALKRRAAETGRTMTSLVEDALRELLRRRPSRRPFRLKFVTIRGRALPGLDLSSRESLYEQMEGRASRS